MMNSLDGGAMPLIAYYWLCVWLLANQSSARLLAISSRSYFAKANA